MGGSLLRVWLVTVAVGVGAAFGGDGSFWLRFGLVGTALGCALALVRRHPAAVLVALGLFGFACGAGAAGAQRQPSATAALAAGVPVCKVTGTILESWGGLGTALSPQVLACEGHPDVRDHAPVVADLLGHPGSTFVATGWLIPLGEDQFDRARARAGAAAELAITTIELSPPTGLSSVAAAVRDGLTEAASTLDPPEAGLIRGLTIGDTEAIADPTLESFRRSGLSHLLAVSGSNVSIVLGAVMLVGARLPFRLRLTGGFAALGLFVLVVGPDASVLRAAAMGAIGLVALATGRRSESLHVLATAVAVVIAARPQIVFSVGLHLSVMATAGIILLAPVALDRLRWAPRVVALPLAVTIGAQVAVVPLLAVVFEEMSLIAPVANLLAAVAVAPATILGLGGGVVAVVHAGAGGLLLRAAEPFASWILAVGELAGEPSWASVQVPAVLGWLLTIPLATGFGWALRRHTRGLPSEP